MAIGEVVGAGLFVGGFVVGIVALCARTKGPDSVPMKKVRLDRNVFVRDCGFLLLSILLLGVSLLDGKLFWWEGIIMLCVYIAYILVVTVMGWRGRQRRRALTTVSLHPDLDGEPDESLLHEGDVMPDFSSIQEETRTPTPLPPGSVSCPTCSRTCMPIRNATSALLQTYFSRSFADRFANTFSTAFSHLFPVVGSWSEGGWFSRSISILSIPATFCLGLTVPVVEYRASDCSKAPGTCDTHDHTRVPNSPSPSHDHKHIVGACRECRSPLDEETPLLVSFGQVANTANICSQIEWHHRWILIIQAFLAPLFIVFSTHQFHTNLANSGYFPGYALALIIGTFLAALVFFLLRPQHHIRRIAARLDKDDDPTDLEVPWRNPFVAFIGFFIGIFWIYFIANEVVGLLKAGGKILRLSDAILGITVLAFGNSVGDLAANVTMARMGYPEMSISACFAGPLLNLLMTMGVSGLLKLGRGPSVLTRSVNVVFTYFGLLMMILLNLVVIPWHSFGIPRFYGLMLLVLYVVVVAVTIGLDLGDVSVFGLPSE